MATDLTVARRFDELEAQMNGLPTHRTEYGSASYETSSWRQWATSAMHIIRASFDENSPHYQHFASEYAKCHGWDYEVDSLKGIFRAAKADYDGGYAFSLQVRISGEIYGDFVILARAALAEGAKDVAAVLACAALEDSLKHFARMNGLEVSDKVMQDVVNALKSKGLVGGAQKTLLDAMPKIRDYAMHANWEKITAQDVGSVLGFVEQFLLAKFS
jgi:hypothetical protein